MNADPPKHRFYCPDLTGGSARLEQAEAHHALHVLRLGKSSRVELFDGAGRRAEGVITASTRSEVEVALESVEGPVDRPRPMIHLGFAAPKGNRLDWLLEKDSELGAAGVRAIRCRRSVASPRGDDDAIRRWRAICASAVRQSRQVWLPEILPPADLAEVLSGGPKGIGLIAHGGPDSQPLKEVLPRGTEAVHILIGPEGGWTEEELPAARQAGFTPARLGQATLRVETAAVAMCAAVQGLIS